MANIPDRLRHKHRKDDRMNGHIKMTLPRERQRPAMAFTH